MEIREPSSILDTVKELIHIKLQNIPYCPEVFKNSISEIDERDIDKFAVVNATVIRVGSVSKHLEKTKFFACTACQAQYQCFADPQDYNKIQTPPICRNVVTKKKNNNIIGQLFQNMNKKKFNSNNNTGNSNESNENKHVPRKRNEMCRNKKFQAVKNSKILINLDYQ
jgi:DNA replicative helicase MCM subunit Mcm2 (Cdc46/Mcm family)